MTTNPDGSVSEVTSTGCPQKLPGHDMFTRFLLSAVLAATLLAAGAVSAANVHGANNAVIGKIDADGTVRGANNAIAGKFASDGTVRGASNAIIGSAKGIKPTWAAGYFFFFFKK